MKRYLPAIAVAGILLLSMFVVFATNHPNNDGDTVVDGTYVYGDAPVENIDILILESFPVQVQVIAKGNLPDGCTVIDQKTQKRVGNTFTVLITTKRPQDAICTLALKPFEERISLDVAGLPKGTYTVDVNGVKKTFKLDADNKLNP